MSSWVMAVEVTPSELVAVDVDRATGGGTLRPRRVPLAAEADGTDPVDMLADAFARALDGSGADGAPGGTGAERPTRLVVATPPDTERRRFEEIAEATALVGLPAPAWLPGPVALVGDRIAAEVEVGGQSVVLDARDGGLTAWPVRRTAAGAEVGSRGPVATGTRLDQLLLGVVRAQLRSLDPEGVAGAASDGPSPGTRTPGAARDLRGEAARLRREIRRARAQLACGEADEATVAVEDHEIVVDRGVFDQLVEHALRETLGEVADGPDEPLDPVVHVLGDHPTPLARRLADLTAGPEHAEDALVLPGAPHDGVLGLAALLLPSRPRVARAASGAQAIRSARAVGSPPTPVGASAVGVGGGSGSGLGPDDGRDLEDDASPTPATGLLLPGDGADDSDSAIPEARIPSSPVQAQRDGGAMTAFGAGAAGAVADPAAPVGPDVEVDGPADPDLDGDHGPADDRDHREPNLSASNGHHDGAVDPSGAGHLVLAGVTPHEVRPATDTPPGGRVPAGQLRSGGYPGPVAPLTDDVVPRSAVRPRRGPDTAPQPVAAADDRAGQAPRGALPVLVVLLVLAVLAAVAVLLVGPDQIDAAFTGLGAGTGGLPAQLWAVSR